MKTIYLILSIIIAVECAYSQGMLSFSPKKAKNFGLLLMGKK